MEVGRWWEIGDVSLQIFLTNPKHICLKLGDFYQTNTLEAMLENLLYKNVKFCPGKNLGGRFFSTATVFLDEILENQAQNGDR